MISVRVSNEIFLKQAGIKYRADRLGHVQGTRRVTGVMQLCSACISTFLKYWLRKKTKRGYYANHLVKIFHTKPIHMLPKFANVLAILAAAKRCKAMRWLVRANCDAAMIAMMNIR